MNNLPEGNLSFEPLTRILYGAVPTKPLLTGVELRVFSHLTEPRSAESLASEIGSHPDNTRLFLDGLVANKLLYKQDERYRKTPLAGAFLVEDRRRISATR